MEAAPSDADLVALARAGSDAAYGRLVARHQAWVRGFLRRVVGGGWAEADDLAQEAFVAGWRSLRLLRDSSAFRSWICGIAWRRAQDRVRGRLRDARRDSDWLEAIELPAGVSISDRLSLTRAMGALAPDVRACVSLCLGEGWTHVEAAEALNLPLGTVKSNVQRGRMKLLKALGGPDDA